LAVAGTAKLADREGSHRSMQGFGLPAPLAGPLSLLVPLGELGIAAGLVRGVSARASAAAAAGLFTIFLVAVTITLIRGRRPNCHCFGRLHSASASGWTVARNGALAAMAMLVVAQPAAELGWIEFSAAGVVAVVAGQAWLWLELLRRYGTALRRIEELETGLPSPVLIEAGMEAPPFVLPDLAGQSIPSDALLGSMPVLLLFSDPGCGACNAVLAEAKRRGPDIVVISTGAPREVAAKAFSDGLDAVLIDEHREVSMLFGVEVVPTAVLVDPDGRIAGGPAVGAAEVAELMRTTAPGFSQAFMDANLAVGARGT
jgi:peroxiredoxin